jgi:hypothetical protein
VRFCGKRSRVRRNTIRYLASTDNLDAIIRRSRHNRYWKMSQHLAALQNVSRPAPS